MQAMSGAVTVDWSSLPYDIICKIATYMDAIEDFFSFSAVCRSWRSVYSSKQWHPVRQKIPFLMLSFCKNYNLKNFISLYRNKIYYSLLPKFSGSRLCFGTRTEWLMVVDNDFRIHLMNPITHVSVDLPSTRTLQRDLAWSKVIHRSLVIKEPNKETEILLVLVIYGPSHQLAFSWPGRKSWVCIQDEGRSTNERFIDFVCVRNRVFALRCSGALVFVDIGGPHVPKLVDVTLPCLGWSYWKQSTLVESLGDLWMIHLYHHWEVPSFDVFSFDFRKRRWMLLSNLGNRTLFHCKDGSICVDAVDRLNCKSNHIYSVGRTRHAGKDRVSHSCVTCVYDMAIGTATPLRIPDNYSFPIWVTPALF